MKQYDVLIIGAGAAGLTAAIYTARKRLKTGVISIDTGGQALLTDHIENYPGIDSVKGSDLMIKFQEQAVKFGTKMIYGEVDKVDRENGHFYVKLGNGERYISKTIILSFGKKPKRLNIPGEDKFLGKGVATCATCDAPLFKDKTVAVVGGGNSALEAVELLNEFAKKIYLIHRRDFFGADEVTMKKVKKMKKVKIITKAMPLEINGKKFVEEVIIKNISDNKTESLKVDGVFVEIGQELNTGWLKGLVKTNIQGEIIIDDRCKTSQSGCFASGDVTTIPYKQIVISAGEGAKAGLEAYKFIKGEDIAIDWYDRKN